MQVLAVCLAAAGGSALIVASCLDRHDDSDAFAEPGYVETTSAPAAANDSSSGPAAPPTVVLQAPSVPQPPVNITINNQVPEGTTTTTSADQGGQPLAVPAPNVPVQQAPLVTGGLVSPAPLVNGGNAPNYTPAPYGATYIDPNAGNNPNNASPMPNGSQPGDSTVTSDGRRSNQGGGAGNLGSGGGATTPTPAPSSPFTTDWGPWGSGYTTPNPSMGAGAFAGGNGPRFPQ